MCNLNASRLVFKTPQNPCSNTGKQFLTINSHLVASLKSPVFKKYHKQPH